MDQDPASPSRQHTTSTYDEDPVTIAGRTFPPARRPRPRPRAAYADPHQPAAADPQAADRTLRTALGIENQLSDQIRAFHLDSLCSRVPLAVGFDVALTVLADIVYRRFARGLHAAYHKQQRTRSANT